VENEKFFVRSCVQTDHVDKTLYKMLQLNHKKLNVYKKSIRLVTEIYELTSSFPNDEKYGLVSQLRRSSVSIPSNIAEGASRSSSNDRRRFYQIARSSIVELDTQINISIELGFLTQNQIKKIEKNVNEVFAMLSKMLQILSME
jgi:four helix bundle protein